MARSSSRCSSRSSRRPLIAALVVAAGAGARRPLLGRAGGCGRACRARSPCSPGRCPCGPSSRSRPPPPAPGAPSGRRSASASSGSSSPGSCFAIGFFFARLREHRADGRPSRLACADRLALRAAARPLLRSRACCSARRSRRALARDLLVSGARACSRPTSRAGMLIDAPPVVLNLMIPGAARRRGGRPVRDRPQALDRPLYRPPVLPIRARAARPRPRPMPTARRSAPLYHFASRVSTALVVPLAGLLVFAGPDILSVYRARGDGGAAAALHPGRRPRRRGDRRPGRRRSSR